MKNKYSGFLLVLFFGLISVFLFYKNFLGFTIQGTDLSFGLLIKNAEMARHTIGFWYNDAWLGMHTSGYHVSPYFLFLNLISPANILWVTFSFSIFMTLLFSYLLLRKWNLSFFPALFGSIAYSFTPHFISLIFAVHSDAIEMAMYPPIIFFLLTIVFDREEKNKFKLIVSTILTGVAWGSMMSDDVQRGLYFSIAIAVYIVVQLIISYGIRLKTLVADVFNKKLLKELGKILVIGLFLVFTFYGGIVSWLPVLQSRTTGATNETPSESAAAAEQKWNFSTMWSFHPAEMVDNVAFGYHGNVSGDSSNPYWGSKEFSGNSDSLGFFVILFLIFGVIFSYKKNHLVKYLFITGILATLLAFGRFFPGLPFYWLFYHLPGMSNFRAPVKFLSLAAFAFALLAAFGVEAVLDKLKDEDKKFKETMKKILIGLGIWAGVGLVWILIVTAMSSDIASGLNEKLQGLGSVAVNNMITALFRMIVFTGLSFGLFALLYRFKEDVRIKRAVFFSFAFLLLFDLYSINWYFIDKTYIKQNEYFQKDGVVDLITKDLQNEKFRVETVLMFPAKDKAASLPILATRNNYLIYYFPYYKIEAMDISSMSGDIPEYTQFFLRTLTGSAKKPVQNAEDLVNINIRLQQLANVKYLITDGFIYNIAAQPIPIYQILTNNTNYVQKAIVYGLGNRPTALFELKGSLPRVAFYHNYLTVTSNEEALNYISDPSFDIGKTVMAHADLPKPADDASKMLPLKLLKSVDWESVIDADVPSDGVILFNSKYDDGWNAYIDGKKVKTFEADYIHTGIYINGGKHTVVFKYEPDRKPFMISFFTVMIGLVLAGSFGIWSWIGKGKKAA